MLDVTFWPLLRSDLRRRRLRDAIRLPLRAPRHVLPVRADAAGGMQQLVSGHLELSCYHNRAAAGLTNTCGRFFLCCSTCVGGVWNCTDYSCPGSYLMWGVSI